MSAFGKDFTSAQSIMPLFRSVTLPLLTITINFRGDYQNTAYV